MTTAVETIVSQLNLDDFRDQFEDMVEDQIDTMSSGGFRQRRKARRLQRILDNDNRFEFAFQSSLTTAVSVFEARNVAGSDQFTTGDFLDWFKDGGWESVLKFLEGLLKLLGPVFGF